MTVRTAGMEDVSALVDLMRDFYAESGYPLDERWAAGSFRDLISDPARGAVWIVEDQGRLLGHVVLSIRFAMEFGGLIGYIDDLYVRPEHRRRGAAAAGLAVLVEECRRRRCHAIEVEVAPDNVAAQAAYGRLGMKPGADVREHLRVVLATATT